MNIPNFADAPIVDREGRLTPIWRQIFTQLITELQNNVSEEGFIIPQKSTADIGKLDNIKSKAAIIYNEQTNKFLANENGAFKTIQTV